MEDGGEGVEEAWEFVGRRSAFGCNTRSTFTGAAVSTVCSVVGESGSGANREMAVAVDG